MKTLDIILIGFFICLFLAGLILVKYAGTQGAECVQNPLTYFENKVDDYCSCFCSGDLYAGQNYINNLKQYNTNKNNLNLSSFNKTLGNSS